MSIPEVHPHVYGSKVLCSPGALSDPLYQEARPVCSRGGGVTGRRPQGEDQVRHSIKYITSTMVFRYTDNPETRGKEAFDEASQPQNN